jgi:hypothetical protein
MAIIIHQTIGGKPKLVTVFTGVTSGRYPPPERCMLYSDSTQLPDQVYSGPFFGELSGGN